MKDKVKERVKEKDRERSGSKSKHSSPSVPESPRDGEFEKGTALKAALKQLFSVTKRMITIENFAPLATSHD